MATVKVSENYAKAKSGKPPVGNFRPRQEMARNPTVKRNFPTASSSTAKPPVKHHVASKATKAAISATPQGRAARVATSKVSTGSKLTRKPTPKKGISLKAPSTDKRTQSFIGKAVDRSPVLLAEFIGGLVIIAVAMFTRTATEKYQDVMASIMARYTAFTGIFFILFLMGSGGKRASQAAAWFGLIIDLGLLFDATNHSMFEDLSAFINGSGLTNATLTASKNKPEEFFATSDIKDTQQQAGVAQTPSSSTPATNTAGNVIPSTTQPPGTQPGTTKAIGNRGSAGGGTSQILDTPTGSLGT